MPNHCANILTISGDSDQLADLKSKLLKPYPQEDSHRDDKFYIDFNGIIPMPEALDISHSGMSAFVETLLSLSEKGKQSLNLIKYPHILQKLEAVCDLSSMNIDALIQFFLDDNSELPMEVDLNIAEIKQLILNEKIYGYTTWYNWRIDNWSTKWNAYSEYIHHNEDGLLEVSFDTAWSPPEGIYRSICASYPQLSLIAHYVEEGMYFAGTYESNGWGSIDDYPCEDNEIKSFMQEYFGIEACDDD